MHIRLINHVENNVRSVGDISNRAATDKSEGSANKSPTRGRGGCMPFIEDDLDTCPSL